MLMSAFAVLVDLSIALSAVQPAAFDDPLPPGAKVRFGTTRFTHADPIIWVGFADDGKTVISSDRTCRFWDVTTRKELPCLKGGWELRSTFALSADGKTLVDWDYDKDELKIMIAASRREIRRIAGEEVFGPKDKRPHQRFVLSPNGRYLVVGDTLRAYETKLEKAPPGFLYLWDLDSGGRIHAWKTGDVYHAEFTADSKTLIVHEWARTGMNSSVRTWDVKSGNEIAHADLPRQLSRFMILPDGKNLIGASRDRESLHRYKIATGKELEIIKDKGGPIFAFALSPDGQNLAIGQPGRVIILRLRDGKELFAVPFLQNTLANGDYYFSNGELLAFSRDGKTLAIAKDRVLELWDVASGKICTPMTPWADRCSPYMQTVVICLLAAKGLIRRSGICARAT